MSIARILTTVNQTYYVETRSGFSYTRDANKYKSTQ